MKFLRTSDLAKAVGVHPKTVRRYVGRGLLPPVEYSPSGYRRFTRRHLDCLRLAWQVYGSQYAGKAIYQYPGGHRKPDDCSHHYSRRPAA